MAHVPQATTAQACGAKLIDPVAGGDRLAGARIGAEAGPVALGLVVFVGNRAFDHQDERRQVSGGGLVEGLQELVADFVREDRMVQPHLGHAGDRPAEDVFEAGLRGGRDGDRIAVASQAGGDPQECQRRELQNGEA